MMATPREHLLGRRIEFDERSRRWPLRRAIEPGLAVQSILWPIAGFLDQGVSLPVPAWDPSGCTGFSRAHALNAAPVEFQLDALAAFDIYRRAKQLDEWPGEDYEGSSVLAAVKAATGSGWVESYWWAFTLDEVIASLATVGPGVAGTWWKSGMWTPDQRGFIRPTGDNVGGHAYCLGGLILELNAAVIYQSWGRWSNITDPATLAVLDRHGLPVEHRPYVGLIDLDDLWLLLAEDGEYCVSLDHVPADPLPDPVDPVTPVELEPVPEPQPGCLPGSGLARRLTRSRRHPRPAH